MSTEEAARLRGIRGATTVESNTRDAILQATDELLAAIIEQNDVRAEDIASVFFSTTQDLNAEFPALAARKLGPHVALMCFHEMDVPGSLPMCLRLTMHVNTTKAPGEMKFVYLRDAAQLRPDLLAQNDSSAHARATREGG
jgi:chorismate mutase